MLLSKQTVAVTSHRGQQAGMVPTGLKQEPLRL